MSQAKASDYVRNRQKVVTEITDYVEMNDLDEMKNVELIDDYISDLIDSLQNLRSKYEVMHDLMNNEDLKKRIYER